MELFQELFSCIFAIQITLFTFQGSIQKNAEIQFIEEAVIRCNYSKDVSILAIYLDIAFIKGVN